MKFICLYDTTSGSITESATEPEVVRVFISVNTAWLTYEELEKFYKKHKVLEAKDRIVAHVQEFMRI